MKKDFIINDVQNLAQNTKIDKDLLLKFYAHLCDNNPLPINKFSMEREVERFIKMNTKTNNNK